MHRQGACDRNIMLSVQIAAFARSSLLRSAVMLAILTPIPATAAATTHASESFGPKGTVAYFEVYHIAHVDVEYRSDITLQDLTSQRTSAQDYVRISAENFRAVDALYAALAITTVNKKEACEYQGPLDVRWAIVITYLNHTKEAIGFGATLNCVQVLSAPTSWRSSRGLLHYVERTFPFMK
jgi:hypothetical protein